MGGLRPPKSLPHRRRNPVVLQKYEFLIGLILRCSAYSDADLPLPGGGLSEVEPSPCQ